MLNDSFLFKRDVNNVKTKVKKTITIAVQPDPKKQVKSDLPKSRSKERRKNTETDFESEVKPKRKLSKEGSTKAEKKKAVRTLTSIKKPNSKSMLSDQEELDQTGILLHSATMPESQVRNLRKMETLPTEKIIPESQVRNYKKMETLLTATSPSLVHQENFAKLELQPPDELSEYLNESMPSEPSNQSFDLTQQEIIQDLQRQLKMGARDYLNQQQKKDFENFQQDSLLLNEQVKPIQPQIVQDLMKVERKPVQSLQNQLQSTEGQIKYLESLNLREVCFNTYTIIEECMQAISPHLNQTKTSLVEKGIFNAYILLTDLAQRKEYLESFNQKFKALCNHLIELSQFMQKKESNYIAQIKQLEIQNAERKIENDAVKKSIFTEKQKNQSSDQQDISLPEIIKEYTDILMVKFNSIKQKLWSNDELKLNSQNSKRQEIPLNLSSHLKDPKVQQTINKTFEEIDALKEIITVSLQKSQTEMNLMRREAAQIADKYTEMKRNYDRIVEKLLPQSQTILAADSQKIRQQEEGINVQNSQIFEKIGKAQLTKMGQVIV